ncbi:MAG TPA: class I SAM-dependent methyltransferase [Saprospiraceae bacterium]|nr:class I SAM-dependent methyltransferase [Saprospiraceae bacterium]
MKINYNQDPLQIIQAGKSEIACFNVQGEKANIDLSVVKSFGEEWNKFDSFDDNTIQKLGAQYFDIVVDAMLNKHSYVIDIGCGTGRWSKYISNRAGFIEAIDPSDAIFTAVKLIGNLNNVRLSKASIDNIPFPDETFDFAMCIGVINNIPDPQKALNDCVNKIKVGGYFYTYLYYNFENKSLLFKILFQLINLLRRVICKMPSGLKRLVCDLLAVILYLPVIYFGKFLWRIGFKNLAKRMPLSFYHDQSFYIIRNDALDRFGTSVEHRFSKEKIRELMSSAGLGEVVIADSMPYWHAVGKRIN